MPKMPALRGNEGKMRGEESACLILAAIAQRWVKDACPVYVSKFRKRVPPSQEQALRDFSAAVADPSSSWIIERVAAYRNMPQRTVLNALLDAAHLPHDYHYSPRAQVQVQAVQAGAPAQIAEQAA